VRQDVAHVSQNRRSPPIVATPGCPVRYPLRDHVLHTVVTRSVTWSFTRSVTRSVTMMLGTIIGAAFTLADLVVRPKSVVAHTRLHRR
jgi:hypothetical protein